MYNNIKALLFDAGRTLNYPRTGNWFFPPNFFEHVEKDVFHSINQQKLEAALMKAYQYLDENHLILSEEEELQAFNKFYKLLFDSVDEIDIDDDKILAIAKDTVFNDDKFIFYEDCYEYIPKFKEHYKLGIVSDTWPSLDRVFKSFRLRDYFDSFVMSSTLGVFKPNEKMYMTALEELDIQPEEALFIDDSPKNIEGAKALGLQAILIVRDGEAIDYDGEYIHNLEELERLLNK
ncbi:HAD family hydrolase [Vallitalea okinawensis]|uniref:HAD family hydrolase n=1 Tax=Vallitalea okinawensis TaxID=2078660 RepID=UPI000CFAD84B|nr:HAD-IA family hydrolase [Vallitalea okinawensis]